LSFLDWTAEAQSSVKLVGAGGAAAANLYNSYGVYYGYYKDNVALAYSAAPISQALTQYNQTLVDFVGVDTALDLDQLEGVPGLVQLPTAGLPLVLGYNLSSSLLANDSLVRTTQTTPPPSSRHPTQCATTTDRGVGSNSEWP
jgi:ABC-type phosphate transport system substrate-binding protein